MFWTLNFTISTFSGPTHLIWPSLVSSLTHLDMSSEKTYKNRYSKWRGRIVATCTKYYMPLIRVEKYFIRVHTSGVTNFLTLSQWGDFDRVKNFVTHFVTPEIWILTLNGFNVSSNYQKPQWVHSVQNQFVASAQSEGQPTAFNSRIVCN